MAKVKFSIIIPTYNSANEVVNAIESIKKQSFKDYEIIVVDDCSTDNTAEILNKIEGIRVVKNQENLKAGGSRNQGLNVAEGEYIIFLDADDYLAEEETLQKINDVIGKDVPDIVYLGFKKIGRDIEEIWIPTEENSTFSKRAHEWKDENVWDVCWNKEFLDKNNIRFVEKKYFEDFVFYYTGIMNANQYKVASFITHIYTRFKDDSMTLKITEQKLQDLYYNVNEFLERAKTVDSDKKADVIYAIYRVVEYSTRLLLEYERIEKQNQLKDSLTKRYSNLIEKYKNINLVNKQEEDIIWICWWQGIENAPEIVKKCLNSVKKYNPDKKIIVVTEKNYKQYVTIPDYIEEKLKTKKMSITHFSDVLRVNLLSKYGGLWLDATCFLTADISEYFKKEFFTIKLPYNEKEKCISGGKWCVFCMYGKSNNVLFDFLKEFYDLYWKERDEIEDYFIMDYAIKIAYENIEEVRKMLDNVPENNANIHMLKEMLNEEYNEIEYNRLLSTNKIHKLAHERKYVTTTEDGKETYYGHIIK